MRFYTRQHKYYCGIDLHARWMYVCILGEDGAVLLHRNLPARPEAFLRVVAPYREDWRWPPSACTPGTGSLICALARASRSFSAHALYMKAIHGGKAKNDRIDSHKIAVLLRGGTMPFAYVYPREMRATRDLLRRRTYLVRKRAELLTHVQMTNSQYTCRPSRRTSPSGAIARTSSSTFRRPGP